MYLHGPRSLASTNLSDLIDKLPGARDGDAESIHRARIATRRLREVLPLVDAGRSVTDGMRELGRALGRARDLDVIESVLHAVERRVPVAATVAAVARQHVAQRQVKARRRLAKAIERLEPAHWRDALPPPGTIAAFRDRYVQSRTWLSTLRSCIAKRGDALSTAVDAAPGVYSPRRLHEVRIAVKKLRYAVEIAEATGAWQPPRLLRDLKRMQERLGETHDLQVALDMFDELDPVVHFGAELETLRGVLASDIELGHQRYAGKRDRLRAAAAAARRFGEVERPRFDARRTRQLLTASAVLVPVAVTLAGLRREAPQGVLPFARES